jgi:hypothetical protein
VTCADAEEQLHALAGAAVWNLADPAVIRHHRDGWLIFMRAQYGWYGTAEAAADALLAGQQGSGIRIGLR